MGTPITDNEPVGGLRDFGLIPVSTQSAPLTIYITNTGGSPINFGSIFKVGSNPGDFFFNASAFVNPLPAGQSTSFIVLFYRVTAGVGTCTIELPHDASGAGTSPFEINLKGEAYVPIPVLQVTVGSAVGTPIAHQQSAAGTSRDFGVQDVAAGPTSSITMFITNAGTGTLSIAIPDMGGTWWTEFLVNSTGMISQLSAGQSTSFTVAFDPTSAGTKDAYVRISHTDAAQPTPYYIPVVGIGTVTPQPSMDFMYGAVHIPSNGSYNVGNRTASTVSNLPFSISNTGNLDLNLTGTPEVVISNQSACSASVNTAPALTTIPPSSSTGLSVDVTPLTSGPWSFQMVIANDDPYQNPYTVTIQGTATVAATEIRVVTQPLNATAGQIFSVPPVIAVTDAAGLVDTNDNTTQVAVAISSGTGDPSAVLSGTLTVTAAGGYLAFTDLAIDLPSSGYTLTFTNVNGALGTAISDPFDVTGGAGGGDGGEEENKCSTGPGQDYAIGALLLLCALTLLARRKAGA
ncbi:MAG: choice-of-anchor D domain-containing protein [Planctomycetes bacterium]|nr:choice-of-anchor D domain-containing protein [Planctomycetota bacterium]